MIVAASENNVIGVNNELPWHLPDDFRYFKNTTSGHVLIMGRKTIESLGKPLKNRTHIVITSADTLPYDDIIIVHSPEEALKKAAALTNGEVFIIGGGEIFKQMLPVTDRVHLTRVHTTLDGDAFFPDLDKEEWKLVTSLRRIADEKHAYPFTFQLWERKIK